MHLQVNLVFFKKNVKCANDKMIREKIPIHKIHIYIMIMYLISQLRIIWDVKKERDRYGFEM